MKSGGQACRQRETDMKVGDRHADRETDMKSGGHACRQRETDMKVGDRHADRERQT